MYSNLYEEYTVRKNTLQGYWRSNRTLAISVKTVKVHILCMRPSVPYRIATDWVTDRCLK